MQLHEVLHERKPDPAAFMGAALRALDAMEALEQPRQFLLSDADSGVAYRHSDMVDDMQ